MTNRSPEANAHALERISGAVDRVTFHSEESGLCVLRVKVRGHRDLVTVIGSAASVSAGEYIESVGNWVNDRTHGMQFKAGQFAFEERPESSSDFYTIFADTPEAAAAKLAQVVTERIPKRFGLHPIDDIQVLTPMNRGGLGARALNQLLQTLLNGAAEPKVTRFGVTLAPGDKVIQQINNYDKDVYNGDIGKIRAVDLEDSTLTVDYDGREVSYDFNELDELSLAYATSVHKAQGSEFPAVVIPVALQHYLLLERNLLYTGVTRGKKLVVLIAQKKALAMAVKNQRSRKRITRLSERLQAAMD